MLPMCLLYIDPLWPGPYKVDVPEENVLVFVLLYLFFEAGMQQSHWDVKHVLQGSSPITLS